MSAIEGRVAQVLNDRELVINRGAEHGVKRGMKFRILAPTPLQIRDPVSGEILDEIDRDKVRVEASEVRQKVAICRTYEVTVIGGLFDGGMSEWLGPRREIPETFDASRYPQPLDKDESYVKIGDRVVQLGRETSAARTREAPRVGKIGTPPSEEDLNRLAAAHVVLAENDIRPGTEGYDMGVLQDAIARRDWVLETEAINGAWNATIQKHYGLTEEDSFHATMYWDEESAVAIALQMALLE